MDTIRICKECQKPLPQNAPEGLCPECLAHVALGSEPAVPGTRVPPGPAALAAQFPQLEILELLGMGGMGMVYKGRQPKLDRLVALKILPIASMPDASFAERFEREAKALAKLNHPGIVAVYDFGQTNEYYYFIMEYVDGMNLRQLIQAKTLQPRQALELVTQICTALQFAHDEKIVHRDIKPENILITKKGQVKIADFGLAKLMGGQPDTALTASQMVMGTMNYMAPEQRENTKDVDHRADIYSLGVVFYEMLTGEVPMGRFDAPSKKVRIDVRLDEVVLHALEREPARRYQHVSEVKSNVENITSTMPKENTVPRTPERSKAKPLPGFAYYVLTRFAMFAGPWLAIALCFRYLLGDFDMVTSLTPTGWWWSLGEWSVKFAPPETVPFHYMAVGAGACCFSLRIAWIILPLILFWAILAWFGFWASGGLKFRQLPPPLRRRYQLRVVAINLGFTVVAVVASGLFDSSYRFKSVSQREFQNLSDQAAEWWFVPNSGAYEKLGLNAAFAAAVQNGTNDSAAWPVCTVTLTVHRTNAEPAVMKVILPGLRASYRFPVTNSWDTTFILDTDSLLTWLKKAAGLDSSAPKFQEETGQIYRLLKAYELQPPQTAKEFINLAHADLRDFSFGGQQGGSFSFGGIEHAPNLILLIAFLCVGWLIASILTIWVTRRIYQAGLVEIEAGRWSPPTLASTWFPNTIWVLFAVAFVSLVAASLVGFAQKSEFNQWLLILLTAATILIGVNLLHWRKQTQKARERGLWPQLGELPTLEHVKRLAQAGEKILAIKLYRQIHPVSLEDAKAAVDKLAGQ